jgi:hypothetical protein
LETHKIFSVLTDPEITVPKAEQYLAEQNFKLPGKFIDMGEGYEHIWMWEYQHKYDAGKIARLADLRFAQRKVKDEDTIPNIIGTIQITIKTTPCQITTCLKS